MQIYMYTFPNGKRYVGQTIYDYEKRAKGGCRYKRSHLVYNAIMKYGWDNIRKEVLCPNCPSKKYMDAYEKAYIALFDTTNPAKGYNLTFGGEGGIPNEETRRKQSDAQKGEKNSNFGKCLSEETKRKISESKKGAKNPLYRPFIIDGVRYEALLEAAKSFGVGQTTIFRWLRGEQKTSHICKYVDVPYKV